MRADAAKLAIAEVDALIGDKQLQVKRLAERQQSFVQDAMIEHVAENYGARYRTVATELRDVLQAIFGAYDCVSIGHSDGIELPELRLLESDAGRIFPNTEARATFDKLLADWSVPRKSFWK